MQAKACGTLSTIIANRPGGGYRYQYWYPIFGHFTISLSVPSDSTRTVLAGAGLGASRGGGGPTLRRLIAAVEGQRLGQPGHRKVIDRIVMWYRTKQTTVKISFRSTWLLNHEELRIIYRTVSNGTLTTDTREI